MNAVDEYIHGFPPEVRARMELIRSRIKNLAPEVVESIAYGMPGYKLYGKPLVYFAGHEKHIGLYALPSAHAAFRQELSGYKQGKGSVQFPLNQELPILLIEKIIAFRIQENQEKVKTKNPKSVK